MTLGRLTGTVLRMTTLRQRVLIAGSALLVIAALGWWILPEGTDETPAKRWFYDLNTAELFAAEASELPPIDAPSGGLEDADGAPAGVLANVIRIEGDEAREVAFLQTYTAEARQLLEASRQGQGQADYERILAGTLVALPPAKPGGPIAWVALSSPDGYRFAMAMETLAGGRPYSLDLP